MAATMRPAAATLVLSLSIAAMSLCPAPSRAEKAAAALPPPLAEVFQQDVAWSPDGEWIAFSEYAGGEGYDAARWAIHVVRADGSERRLLVENAQFVTWSPDGARLAFASGRGGNWDIYTIGADGGRLERLTHDPAKDVHPAWSADGDRLAFVSDRPGNREIYVLTPKGTTEGAQEPIRLTHDPAADYNPSWSPDASRLVFYREVGDGMDQILTIAADGSGEQVITRDGNLNTFPCFLPDGTIAFSSKTSGGEAGDAGPALIQVAADGTARRRVGTVSAFFARWSPDGRRVAFISGRWPRSAIYLMNADGTDIRKLVN